MAMRRCIMIPQHLLKLFGCKSRVWGCVPSGGKMPIYNWGATTTNLRQPQMLQQPLVHLKLGCKRGLAVSNTLSQCTQN